MSTCVPSLVLYLAAFAAPTMFASEAPFSLPKLPYEVNALEPVIDAKTLTMHHDQLHKTYVEALNKAVVNDPKMEGVTLSALFLNASKLQQVVRDNAGGHYNHSFFWTIMAPKGQGGEPSPALAARIVTDFGSLDAMKTKFEKSGLERVGSGWVWVVWTGSKLAITSTSNQDNPLMDDVEIQGAPILANDVWEHAYETTYQTRRVEYLKSWWSVVNWKEANSRFTEATAAKVPKP